MVASSAMEEQQFERLKAQQVKQILDSGERVFLLNRVSDIMFNQGFIPGSVHVVLEDIPTSELIPADMDTPIISHWTDSPWRKLTG